MTPFRLALPALSLLALPAAAQPGRIVATLHAHDAITPALNAASVASGTSGRFGLGVRVDAFGPVFVRASVGAGSAPDDRLSDTRVDLRAARVSVGATFGRRVRVEPTLTYGQERMRRISGGLIGTIREADVRVGVAASRQVLHATPVGVPLDVSVSGAVSVGRAVGRYSFLYSGTYAPDRQVYGVGGFSLGVPVSAALTSGSRLVVEPLYGLYGRTPDTPGVCRYCVGGRGTWGVNARLSVALR